MMGDVNNDSSLDVLDIVQIVGYVIGGQGDFDTSCADYNNDSNLDVLIELQDDYVLVRTDSYQNQLKLKDIL